MNQSPVKQIEKYIQLGKADLHIHSDFSDGRPTIEEILEYVEHETDLDVIAITDHDTIEGALLAEKIVKKKGYRFEVIVGEEVTTKEGHVIGLFLKKPIKPEMSAHKVVKLIKKQGGIVLMPHPTRHVRVKTPKYNPADGIGVIALIKEKKRIDAIEGINATPALHQDNLRAMFLNDTLLFKAEVGGSDAHIVEAIGMGFTIFEGKKAKDLKRSILCAQTRAVNREWKLFGLFKYLFFFLPKGFRIFIHTLLNGRKPKRIQIINIPKKSINSISKEIKKRSQFFSRFAHRKVKASSFEAKGLNEKVDDVKSIELKSE